MFELNYKFKALQVLLSHIKAYNKHITFSQVYSVTDLSLCKNLYLDLYAVFLSSPPRFICRMKFVLEFI